MNRSGSGSQFRSEFSKYAHVEDKFMKPFEGLYFISIISMNRTNIVKYIFYRDLEFVHKIFAVYLRFCLSHRKPNNRVYSCSFRKIIYLQFGNARILAVIKKKRKKKKTILENHLMLTANKYEKFIK